MIKTGIYISFEYFLVERLHVSRVNGRNISTYQENMKKMKFVERIENLTVTENVSVTNLNNVSTINGVSWKDLKEVLSLMLFYGRLINEF